jgi:hypothetical protein
MSKTPEDPRVTAARQESTGGPRHDVLLPASVLVTMYYDLQRTMRGLLAAYDEMAGADRNCVRCSGGPPDFCACLTKCTFPGCGAILPAGHWAAQ